MFVRDLHNLQHTMDQMFDSMMSRYDHMGMGGIGNMGNMGMGNMGIGMDDDMMMGDQSMNRGLMDDKDSSAMQVGAHTGNRKHRAGHIVRRGESEMMHDRAGRHGMMGGMMGSMLGGNMPVMNMKMSPIDLKESPNEYIMTVEMAGVDRKSIDIAADKDKHMVTIRAEKREEHTEGNLPSDTTTTAGTTDTSTTGTTGTTGTGQMEGQAAAGTVQTQGDRSVGLPAGHRYHMQERKFGMVERSLRIPDDCDFDRAEASYENGVLRLRIPRMAKAESQSFTQKIHLS